MTYTDQDKSSVPQQRIEATQGSTITDVVQAMINGHVEGDVHIGDKIYLRSDLEALDEYLARATADFEARMYQTLRQSDLPTHPYKFLHPFELQDADIFFGRSVAVEQVYDRVMAHRLTVLHARSGAGKTSLLNAGLSPALIKAGHLPVYISTRAFREDLAIDIKQAVVSSEVGPWPELLADLSLRDFLGLVCAHLGHKTQGLVIMLDQFEQFLVSLPEPNLRAPFIRALSDCYEDRSLPVRFIISLRREHTFDLDEFEPIIPRILQNRCGLPVMGRTETIEAITGPVKKLEDVSFEPALVEALLDALGQEVELAHLQIVCTKLYDSRPQGERVITAELYESLGGIERILTTYLEERLAELPHHKRTTARNILKELVSSEASNRVLTLPELQAQVRPEPDLLEDVLESLVNTRLLRREQQVDSGVKEYELAHAYLAREVRGWIDQDELEVKKAQELLQRELASWRVHQTLVDEERLDILAKHIKHLSIDQAAQTLLFRSALEQGHNVSFWLAQIDDKEAVIADIANTIVDDRSLREKMSSDLKFNLERALRPRLLAALWAVFEDAKGSDRRNAANVLWSFRAWLPGQNQLQVMRVLAPIWLLKSLPIILLLVFIAFGGSNIWTFVTREKAAPGNWLTISAGEFVMGCDRKEAEFAYQQCLLGATDETDCREPDILLGWQGQQTDTQLPAFDIMDNEVTNAQYKQCLEAGICTAPQNWEYGKADINKPATAIDWTQAATYCQWLGGRLPTEGEWEKAARGPEGHYFPWGNTWDPSKANIEHADSGDIQPITAYAASDISDYGIKNMAGNVREWTASLAIDHPEGNVFSNDVLMPGEASPNVPIIVRGGSWRNVRFLGMGSIRGHHSISEPRPEIGFRCVCPEVSGCREPWTMWWRWVGEYEMFLREETQ